MRRTGATGLALVAAIAAGGGGYWVGVNGIPDSIQARLSVVAMGAVWPREVTFSSIGPVIYYQHPDGKPFYSLGPKDTSDGRQFRPVYASQDVSFEDTAARATRLEPTGTTGGKRILYYRNPMGLPDTSPTPKKDWMGMDYIPVYEGEEQEHPKTVRVSLDKIQRSGVKTDKVEQRVIVRQVRAIGTVKHDESRATVVTMRSEGFVEDLFVSKTGQHVHAGEPLFRVYSSQIQQAQIDLIVAIRAVGRGVAGADADRQLEGAMQRLRNLAVPESRIREVRETGANPRTLDWPSPATGDVIEKRIVKGQRIMPGDELYRITDHSHVWVIAEVAEADLSEIKIGTRAAVTVRAYAAQPIEGEVTLIYPELKAETRTARVRIDMPNPDSRLKVDMYADVVFRAGADEKPVPAVPESALIDSGTRQIVLIAKGEGRFEPRAVKLGRRGGGFVEISDGVTQADEVVTSATFLIDAESNLRAALQAFTQPESPK
jgi:membrane fusion protein, copper/silver efflux system